MKKLLSAILTICLLMSCIAPAMAASFPDLEARHAWAVPAIDYMMSKGIVNGYEDDTFRPDRTVSRAEFIKMLDETFGLTATAAIPYTDVPADQWYAPYVKKAVAQGYLLNYGSLLNPNGALSRQEAAALLVRYLDLDDSLKAATTTFTDYSSIKVAYRDYVLLAAGAGIINGFEDDTFRPDQTLNRAQALTILYRAAGTICNDNLVESEAGAGDKNAVITKSNINVTGATFPGRVIITEGVSGGTVTINESVIGELIIRGTPTVILSGCSVDSVIVDCPTKGKTIPISMAAGTAVKSMTLRTPADISTASKTTLTKLTVEEGASRSSVSGSGTFTTAVINASGFVSDKLPTNYTLAKGISATFAEKVYTSGSTPSASDTGFTTQPSLYTSTSYNYLTLTPTATGTVHYYYTNTASVPTAELFDSYYNAAITRSSFFVTANRSVDTQIGTTSAVSSYSHVVVRFTDTAGNKYQPVVLTNRSSSAFTVSPTVTTRGSYQYLAFTPAVSGTVFYYYTNSSTALTAASFANAYSSSATSSGEIEVLAGQAVNETTAVASLGNNYAYVAVMLMDSNNREYQPILVPIGNGGTTSNTGFTAAPYCTMLNNNTGVAIGFTSTYSGTLEYYFTTGSTTPTSTQFEYNKTLAQVTLTGSLNVRAGEACYTPLINAVSPAMYPYIVVRLTSSSGVDYTPVVIKIGSAPAGGGSTTPGTTGSGFATMPTLSYAAGKFVLNFQAYQSGTVYYYLTTSPNSPGSAFMGNYNSSTGAMTTTKLGGMLGATGFSQSLTTVLDTDLGEDYDYMAIMYQSGNTTYTPVVIAVPDVEAVVIQNTGFAVGPIYNEISAQDNYMRHQIELATSLKGTVWYYFTNSSETPKSSEVIEAVLYGGEGVYDRGRKDVEKHTAVLLPFAFTEAPPEYVVMMVVDENNNHYLPVVMATSGMYGASSMTSGLSGTPTVSASGGVSLLNYTCVETGKLYYYYTNNAASINTVWDFFTGNFASNYYGYLSSSAEGVRGTVDLSVGKGSVYLPVSKSTAAYTHVAIMLQSKAYEPGGYRKPVVIALNGSGGSNGSTSGYSGFNGTPYLSGDKVHFTPRALGTVYYGFTQTDSTSELYDGWGSLGGLGSVGGAIGTANISAFLASANGGNYVSIAYPGYPQTITIPSSVQGRYNYMAIWTVDTNDTMSTVEFVRLNSFSQGGLGGLGGGIYGFSALPQYNSIFKQISFTPAVSGQLYYFYTNSTVNYNTHDAFSTAYIQASNSNSNIAGSMAITAGQASSITVTVNNIISAYKYVWLYIITSDGNYTPVYCQLS